MVPAAAWVTRRRAAAAVREAWREAVKVAHVGRETATAVQMEQRRDAKGCAGCMLTAVQKARHKDARGDVDCIATAVRKARRKDASGDSGHRAIAVRKAQPEGADGGVGRTVVAVQKARQKEMEVEEGVRRKVAAEQEHP